MPPCWKSQENVNFGPKSITAAVCVGVPWVQEFFFSLEESEVSTEHELIWNLWGILWLMGLYIRIIEIILDAVNSGSIDSVVPGHQRKLLHEKSKKFRRHSITWQKHFFFAERSQKSTLGIFKYLLPELIDDYQIRHGYVWYVSSCNW